MRPSSPHGSSRWCVALVANRAFALTNSRMLLVRHFLEMGWQVVAIVGPDGHVAELEAAGVTVEIAPFHRGGLAPLSDLRALLALVRSYTRHRPSLIHHFHLRPVVLGNWAARIVPRALVVNTIPGLGYAFTRRGLTRRLAECGYRLSLGRSDATIFQNPDDRRFFVERGWVLQRKAHLILSAGVDTERFRPVETSRPAAPPRVLMVARLLWQKGVREFVEAAEMVRRDFPDVRFEIAGEWDPAHPDAVPRDWVRSAEERGAIRFVGYLSRIERQLPLADIFVLPSYYLEGVPRVLLEAAACAVPVVTVDVPGCREAVLDGRSGRLVPPRESGALANAISDLLRNPVLRRQMGEAGREFMCKRFEIHAIARDHLTIYRSIGGAV